MINLSVIVPVYNRPDEIEELLDSLARQTCKDFEVIVVEDGSSLKCDFVIDKYKNILNVNYFYKDNEKPAIARNYGIKKATGNYYLFFDSDCIIPPGYIDHVLKELNTDYVDCYGGPDSAHPSFSNVQKAINFAMTSFITTGGIRGKQKIDKFYPRSFNMGFSKAVFEKTGGFPVTKMHPGEDMVLSIEIVKRGFKTRLLENAYVFHKRRTNLSQFYKQVYKFGKTRVIISEFYPETFRIFYIFPSVFLLGMILLIVLSFFSFLFIIPVILFIFLLFIVSLLTSKNFSVALLSVVTGTIQQVGYGTGFLFSWIRFSLLKKDDYNLKKNPFY